MSYGGSIGQERDTGTKNIHRDIGAGVGTHVGVRISWLPLLHYTISAPFPSPSLASSQAQIYCSYPYHLPLLTPAIAL